MPVTIDTATVLPRERLDFWADVVERIFFPVNFRSAGDKPFNGRISLYRLGRVTMTRVTSEPTLLTRTPSLIAKQDPEALHLFMVLQGRAVVSQDDRVADVTAGKMVIYDTSRPFSITTADHFELVTIETPRLLLGMQNRRSHLETVQPVGCETVRSIVLPFLFRFSDRLHNGSYEEGDAELAESAIDLVRALYVDRRPSRAATLGSVARLPAVKAYIEAHLGEDLRPDTVARAHFMSTRTLQKLFQAEGLTISDWIRDRRLERCHRDLLNPCRADEQIGAIAMRWGMSNPAHFSRTFRAAYGYAPSELRRKAELAAQDRAALGGARHSA